MTLSRHPYPEILAYANSIVFAVCASFGMLQIFHAPSVFSQQRVTSRPHNVNTPPLLPDSVVYMHLFHHVAAFGHRAEELETRKEDSHVYRNAFTEKLKLDKRQSELLTQISYEYEARERLIQAKVKERVAAFRSEYSGGRLDPSNPPPKPDPVMHALFLEKQQLILEMRNEFEKQLGSSEFERINGMIRTRIAPNIKLVQPSALQRLSENGEVAPVEEPRK